MTEPPWLIPPSIIPPLHSQGLVTNAIRAAAAEQEKQHRAALIAESERKVAAANIIARVQAKRQVLQGIPGNRAERRARARMTKHVCSSGCVHYEPKRRRK